MALIIDGETLCPLCRHPLYQDGQIVGFSWFECCDPRLAVYSDAGLHFDCVASSQEHDELIRIYLEQLGEEGIRPNRTRVVTVSNNIRAKTRMHGIIIRIGDLFSTLEMPSSTARELLQSSFWTISSDRAFSGKGFDACHTTDGEWTTLVFRCFPYAMRFDECAAEQVQIIERRIPFDRLARVLAELKQGLQVAMFEESNGLSG